MVFIGDNPPDYQIEEIILEKIKFGLRNVISGSLREEMKMTTDWDIFTDDVIRQITYYLMGNKVNTEEYDDVVKIYPFAMWDELVEDFAPSWFKKRWPPRHVKETRHRTVNNYRVCPHLDVPKKKHIHWLKGVVNL